MFGAQERNRALHRAGLYLIASLLACWPAAATNLVTGNGFGFAVVEPQSATVTKFYAHPYSFTRPDPRNPLSEGIETTNFLKSLSCGPATAEYYEDSHIVRTHSTAGEGFIFMPFGLERPALVFAWQPESTASREASCKIDWNHPVRDEKSLQLSGRSSLLLHFDGVPESLLAVPINTQWRGTPNDRTTLSGSDMWVLVSLEDENEARDAAEEVEHWFAGLAPKALVARELAQMDRWRVKPTVHFTSEAERHLWRQSEVILRMAQSREPNRPGRYSHGLIVASLPDGVWFTPWVRDMAYAAAAFARMGHQQEARDALLAYFNAQPTGKMRAEVRGGDYQISVVRYFGDGSEEPFFTMEGSTNIEFDDWGLVLWLLGEYMHQYNDAALLEIATYRGPLYTSARDFVVKPLLANLETYKDGLIVATDTSIWEERQKDAKHFAFSTAAAIAGLRGFAEVARRAGDESTRMEIQRHVELLEKGFAAAFIRDGQLHGTLEPGVKNDIDGASLAIINLGVVTDPALMRNTAERMELLRVASGGYRRVRSTYTDPAIFEYWYERQEFVFVDLSLAEVFRRIGRSADADAMLKRIVDKAAADHNIIPEMYVAVPCPLFPGAIGDPTSARPMVGYGAGAYILHLIEREHLRR
jgi:hypothetical protein